MKYNFAIGPLRARKCHFKLNFCTKSILIFFFFFLKKKFILQIYPLKLNYRGIHEIQFCNWSPLRARKCHFKLNFCTKSVLIFFEKKKFILQTYSLKLNFRGVDEIQFCDWSPLRARKCNFKLDFCTKPFLMFLKKKSLFCKLIPSKI